MPIHVTTTTIQNLSNKTFVDNLSTNGIVYTIDGNSNNWNSTYSTTEAQSAFNLSTFTTVNTQSANYDAIYSIVQTNSAIWGTGEGGNGIDIGVRELTGNWESTYTTVQTNSSVWEGSTILESIYTLSQVDIVAFTTSLTPFLTCNVPSSGTWYIFATGLAVTADISEGMSLSIDGPPASEVYAIINVPANQTGNNYAFLITTYNVKAILTQWNPRGANRYTYSGYIKATEPGIFALRFSGETNNVFVTIYAGATLELFPID